MMKTQQEKRKREDIPGKYDLGYSRDVASRDSTPAWFLLRDLGNGGLGWGERGVYMYNLGNPGLQKALGQALRGGRLEKAISMLSPNDMESQLFHVWLVRM